MNAKFFDLTTALDQADTVEKAWRLGLAFFAAFGATHICLTAHAPGREFFTKWSTPDWVLDAYLESDVSTTGSLVAHCQTSLSPYFSGYDAERRPNSLTPERIRFLDTLRQVDITHGIIFPVNKQPDCQWGYFSFNTRLSREDVQQIFERNGGLIGLAGLALFHRVEQLSLAKQRLKASLSAREEECLLWLAKGLRNDRIAEKMGVKPITVEYHLLNCRKKLGATTREQALVIAVMNSLIRP
jgi:DNA-binding CsgD family transcriptional regulator|tara:strand:- start:4998 stop:5723 length:726 start_codon:yes stop_codon:yes gene_type:complete